MSPTTDISLPLQGFKVLDLTTFLSGPYCTQVMADLGADVVKVESPNGDSSRHIPPHFVNNDSAYYLANNRNKRSLAVDLKSEEGLALIQKLIATWCTRPHGARHRSFARQHTRIDLGIDQRLWTG